MPSSDLTVAFADLKLLLAGEPPAFLKVSRDQSQIAASLGCTVSRTDEVPPAGPSSPPAAPGRQASCYDTAHWIDLKTSAAGSPHTPDKHEPPHLTSRRALPYNFYGDILGDGVMQHLLNPQLLGRAFFSFGVFNRKSSYTSSPPLGLPL